MVSARLFGSLHGSVTRNPVSHCKEGSSKWVLRNGFRAQATTWRNTPLGRELHLDLLMVFMGLWDQWEIPMILEDHGLIDDLEADNQREAMREVI
jgi:hypothetical protein